MIEIHTYLLFIGASVLLVIAPGPDMAYMLTRTIVQGRRAGIIAAIGINTGAYVHVVAAVLGLSTILATSSIAFTVVKWVGACYLVWIGIQALTAKLSPIDLEGGNSRHLNERDLLARIPERRTQPEGRDLLSRVPAAVCRCGQPEQDPTAIDSRGYLQRRRDRHQRGPGAFRERCIGEPRGRSPKIAIWLNKAMGAVFISMGIRLANEKL